MDYVTELVGFRPDGYVLIDLDVFVRSRRQDGRREIRRSLRYGLQRPCAGPTIDLKAGMQRLNGEQAMGLVRFPLRLCHGRSAARERAAGFHAGCHAPVGLRLEPLAFALGGAAALGATVTDLSTRNLVWLAESVALCGTSNLQTLTIPYTFSGDGMYVLADPYETADVVNAYLNPYETDVSPDDIYGG